MTKQLELAFTEASKLPPEEQNILAEWLLAELSSEKRWSQLLPIHKICWLRWAQKLLMNIEKEKHKGRRFPLCYGGYHDSDCCANASDT